MAATDKLRKPPTLSKKVLISLNVDVLVEQGGALQSTALKLKKVFAESIHALATRGSSAGKEEIVGWQLYRINSMRRPATSGSIGVLMSDNLGRVKSGSNTSSYYWDSEKSLIAEVNGDHMDDPCREGEEAAVVIVEKV